MPCNGCSALHGVNPNLKKKFLQHFLQENVSKNVFKNVFKMYLTILGKIFKKVLTISWRYAWQDWEHSILGEEEMLLSDVILGYNGNTSTFCPFVFFRSKAKTKTYFFSFFDNSLLKNQWRNSDFSLAL